MEPGDVELVERAQTGDLEAFGEFVCRYERRVAVVLARLLDDERDVEEATQDVFVQAWRSLERFLGDAAVFTWLYRIAVNEALMRRRRRRPALSSSAARTCMRARWIRDFVAPSVSPSASATSPFESPS